MFARVKERVQRRQRRLSTRLAIWRAVEHVHGPRRVTVGDTDVVLAMLGRDCAYHLKDFYDHHAALGIAHFVYLDNGSTDDSVAIASQFPNTTVLRSNLDFRHFQNALKAAVCTNVAKGGWRLCIDDDERFDYPNSDSLSLSDIAARLNVGGYTGLLAQMLEMVPAGPLRAHSNLSMADVRRVFDRCNLGYLRRMGYRKVTGPLAYFCGLNHVETADQCILYNGLRHELFNEHCAVSKHPLFRMSPEVKPMIHPHVTGGLKVAPVDAVLYHYKFAGGFLEKERVRAAQGRLSDVVHNEFMLRSQTFAETPDLELSCPGMETRPGFDRLYESGFLFTNDRGRQVFETTGA